MLNEAEILAKLVKRLKEETSVRTEADRVRQAFAAELLSLVATPTGESSSHDFRT